MSVKVNGNAGGTPASAGVISGSGAASLLTKAGRIQRRDSEAETGRKEEAEQLERSLGSRWTKDTKRDKGKGKDKGDRMTRERAERNSMALAHALNTSASLAPSSTSLTQPLRSSKPHPKSQSRPHSQIIAPPLSSLTPRTSKDSQSSNATASSDHSNPHNSYKGKEKTVPNFSTLDRTILEELKLSLTARESQFVFKGPGGGLGQKGEKGVWHHPFLKEEVPYPRSYDKAVVDLDVWETSWTIQVCDSVTWHVFETPPTKVLDLGCGDRKSVV